MTDGVAPTEPVLRRSLLIGAMVVLTLLGVIAVQQILGVRTAILTGREQALMRLTIGLADQVEQGVLISDNMLRNAIDDARGRAALPAEALRHSMIGIRPLLYITLVDPAGRVIVDTRLDAAPALPPTAADLMTALAADRADSVRIGAPFRLPDGRWSALLARRIDGPDGGFAGAGLAWLSLETFQGYFRSADIADGGNVRLLRSDGVILAIQPQDEAAVGTIVADGEMFRELRARGTSGVVRLAGAGTEPGHIAASRELRTYPLVVQAVVTDGAAVAAWRNFAIAFAASAGLAAIIVGALLAALNRRAEDVDRLIAGHREARDAAEAASARLRQEMDERARAEDALRHAQRIEVMGQLTGAVAHDFNNLLTVLLGNLDLLEMDPALSARARERIPAMRRAAAQGEQLTGQLLAFSRRQKLRPKRVDVGAAVAALTGLVQSAVGSRVRVRIDATPGVPPALVDPHQLELMLFNLVINARDAMPEGGTLSIAIGAERIDAPANADDPPPGDYVILRLRDTGTGMAPEVQARATEPFFTTKTDNGGAGLGLSQVYGVAKQSGGGVRIISAPARGTTVSVLLPIAPAEPPAVPVADPPDLRPGEIRVLLVDDDAAVRTTTALILTDLGFAVREAPGSEVALGILQSDAPIDVMVTDIAMPGMRGAELAQAASRLRPALPVVFLSGHADPAIVGDGSGAPRRMVRKPFQPAELAAEIASVLPRPDK